MTTPTAKVGKTVFMVLVSAIGLLFLAILVSCVATRDVARQELAAKDAPPNVSSAAPPTPSATMVTYKKTEDEAWRVLAADHPGLKATITGQAEDGSICSYRVSSKVGIRLCSVEGKVERVVVTSRDAASLVTLDQAITSITKIVSPEAEPADLARVKREARAALNAGSWTTLCPYTRCFKVSPLGGGWLVAASASDT